MNWLTQVRAALVTLPPAGLYPQRLEESRIQSARSWPRGSRSAREGYTSFCSSRGWRLKGSHKHVRVHRYGGAASANLPRCVRVPPGSWSEGFHTFGQNPSPGRADTPDRLLGWRIRCSRNILSTFSHDSSSLDKCIGPATDCMPRTGALVGCDQTAMRNSMAENETRGTEVRRPAWVFLSETRP